MKGKLIIFLAASQIGKDYCADYLIRRANETGNLFDIPIDFRYATAYKVRKRREDDPAYIHCVNDEKEIPKEFDLSIKVIDSQTVAYSSCEIEQGIKDKKGIVICATSVELVEKLKARFPQETISILILGGIKTFKSISETEAKRYGTTIDNPIVVASAEKRYKNLEQNIAQLNNYYEKADYILRNRYSISRYLDHDSSRIKKELNSLCFSILQEMDIWGHKRKRIQRGEEKE